MIHALEFIADHRCFKIGDTLTFRSGLNLLVGDQGSGKSTALRLIINSAKSGALDRHDRADAEKVCKLRVDPMRVMSFDFEKDNPRVSAHFSDRMDYGAQITSRWKSHGEFTNMVLHALLQIDKPTILLVDEPDMALSMRSITKLIDIFKDVVSKGCQVLAAVHHPWIIESTPEVYSLEHRRWMSSAAFLVEMRKPEVR